jgi:predicted TIM-barrel fold metal-dependent hydrolase
MLDGDLLVDAHVHAATLSSVRPSWLEWAEPFSRAHNWRAAYDENGDPAPAALDALFESEGVDRVLLFCEYSPRATGIQAIEDNLPIVAHNPDRFRLVANVNPHLHYPVTTELERQLSLGAIALKLHPVHAGFRPNDRELVPAYELCRDRGIPVIVHTGGSTFPGARARFGNPELMVDVIEDFPEVNFVLAHGGRGWWYDTAAHLALSHPNVWLDLAGLPPKKLPEYYARFDLVRLAGKWIFGTDWPGVPGPGRNARAIADLGLPREIVSAVLGGNAIKVYPGMA